MSIMIKINERFERYSVIGESDIYRKFSEQFEKLFNADEIAENDDEFEKFYVHDYDFEQQLDSFRNSQTNMVKFCVGYTGIGKTTSIRHCFGLGVSKKASKYTNKKELVFPTFLDGYQLEDIQKFDLALRIAAVCTEFEERHPGLREFLKTIEGKKELYEFIREHTAFALENINPVDAMDMDENQLIVEKLKSAHRENAYEFWANKLKYYIMKNYDKYERLVIILDDIETLPEKYQGEIIAQFLKFHECMQNTDYPGNHRYHINLLISVRPHTHRIFRYNRKIETFPISEPAILKKDSVDLDAIFKNRFEYYKDQSIQDVGNVDTWLECYNEVLSMNSAFEGKYKDMIKNLCFMNIREALASYAKVFANRFWVQKNKVKEEYFTVRSPEYSFNNINVIRALACNEEQVYWGDSSETIIPNIFLTTEDNDDNSIICLLVIQYFRKKKRGEVYGVNSETLKSVIDEWTNIFGSDLVKKFIVALEFLFERKILRKSIYDTDDIDTLDTKMSLTNESKLYISPRGNEMYEMLGRDSVLLEMLRENVWRDFENRNYSELSSYELMREFKQKVIFQDLLDYLDYLCEVEDDVLSVIKVLKKNKDYKIAFGNAPATQILLAGVRKSLDYSGIINDEEIAKKYMLVRNKALCITKNF